MPKGSATGRRAGPPKDPRSGRSEKLGTGVGTLLPSEGHGGRPPAFPLPQIKRENAVAAKAFRAREIAIWRAIWKSPQAAAWARDPWRWPTIGEYCRIKASVELEAGGNAALVSRLREYRTEVGLSPDGLRLNGWAIATDELAEQAEKKVETKKAPPVRRLRAVKDVSGD